MLLGFYLVVGFNFSWIIIGLVSLWYFSPQTISFPNIFCDIIHWCPPSSYCLRLYVRPVLIFGFSYSFICVGGCVRLHLMNIISTELGSTYASFSWYFGVQLEFGVLGCRTVLQERSGGQTKAFSRGFVMVYYFLDTC